jgi:hypothetical protein
VLKKPVTKKWVGGEAQGVGPEFKFQHNNKKLMGLCSELSLVTNCI